MRTDARSGGAVVAGAVVPADPPVAVVAVVDAPPLPPFPVLPVLPGTVVVSPGNGIVVVSGTDVDEDVVVVFFFEATFLSSSPQLAASNVSATRSRAKRRGMRVR